MLVTGVILVCKPAFLFPNLSPGTVEKDDLSYLGIFLAVTACIASGLMDVLVAKCVEVSASVLMLWTAIMGLVISIIYCLKTPESEILSADILHISWQDWTLYLGMFIVYSHWSGSIQILCFALIEPCAIITFCGMMFCVVMT